RLRKSLQCLRHVVWWRLIRFDPPRHDVVALRHLFDELASILEHRAHAFAIIRNKSVEIDQSLDAIGNSICNARNHHTAITVTNEDDVAQILVENRVDDVIDVSVQTDIRSCKMHAVALSGELWTINLKTFLTQQRLHFLECPRPTPCTMNDNNRRFRWFSLRRLSAGFTHTEPAENQHDEYH